MKKYFDGGLEREMRRLLAYQRVELRREETRETMRDDA